MVDWDTVQSIPYTQSAESPQHHCLVLMWGSELELLPRDQSTWDELMSGNLKHGHKRSNWESPTYQSWKAMLKRCRNPNHKSFQNYGGRGVTVCARWDPAQGGSFENFLSDMGERPSGTTLDKDKNGAGNIYSPENCCWLTPSEQATYKRLRGSHYVTYQGQKMILADAARLAGVNRATIFFRIRKGWSEDRLFLPPRYRRAA